MTVRDAAERLGVTRQRVHALIRVGRIRVVADDGLARVGGRFAGGGVHVDEQDVERVAGELGR